MKWFGTSRLDDERILHLKNKIYREVYTLIIVLCSLSLLVKLLWFRSDLEAIITELVILGASSLYYGFRAITLGIYYQEVEAHDSRSKIPYSRKNILSGLGTGIAISLFFGIRSAILYADGQFSTQAWYFFIVFMVSLLIYLPFLIGILAVSHAIANKASKKASDNDLLDS